jgi:hypothetical protein
MHQTEAFSIMTNSIRFTRFSRVAGIAFAVLVFSIGNPNMAHAEHAASPKESAAAVALNCFETWLDRPADFIAAGECMYRVWQIASRNHSRILTASLAKIVIRDIIMHVLVWMWDFGWLSMPQTTGTLVPLVLAPLACGNRNAVGVSGLKPNGADEWG